MILQEQKIRWKIKRKFCENKFFRGFKYFEYRAMKTPNLRFINVSLQFILQYNGKLFSVEVNVKKKFI